MADQESKLRSVGLLAQAMRRVFTEAVEEAVEPVNTGVKALRTEVRDVREEVRDVRETMATKEDLETTNKNVQSQLARQRKDVAGHGAASREYGMCGRLRGK